MNSECDPELCINLYLYCKSCENKIILWVKKVKLDVIVKGYKDFQLLGSV